MHNQNSLDQTIIPKSIPMITMRSCFVRTLLVLLICGLTVLPATASDKPVNVLILAGQSNMVGHGKTRDGLNPEYDPSQPQSAMNRTKSRGLTPRQPAKREPSSWLGVQSSHIDRHLHHRRGVRIISSGDLLRTRQCGARGNDVQIATDVRWCERRWRAVGSIDRQRTLRDRRADRQSPPARHQ